VFPWDVDLDFQMLVHSMDLLSKNYNGMLFQNRYLIDVNPHYKYRFHQNNNVIDARFIGNLILDKKTFKMECILI
jgi:hypothetical protein